jgi:hypothetical protein
MLTWVRVKVRVKLRVRVRVRNLSGLSWLVGEI